MLCCLILTEEGTATTKKQHKINVYVWNNTLKRYNIHEKRKTKQKIAHKMNSYTIEYVAKLRERWNFVCAKKFLYALILYNKKRMEPMTDSSSFNEKKGMNNNNNNNQRNNKQRNEIKQNENKKKITSKKSSS